MLSPGLDCVERLSLKSRAAGSCGRGQTAQMELQCKAMHPLAPEQQHAWNSGLPSCPPSVNLPHQGNQHQHAALAQTAL